MMSTIRPLATIAVLAALGVFLAYEINQGPVVAMNDEWSSEDPALEAAEEPPAWSGESNTLTAVKTPNDKGMSATARTAPSWAESSTANNTSESADSSEPAATQSFPTLPDLPTLDEKPTKETPVDQPPPVKGQSIGTTLAGQAAQPMPSATQEKLTLPETIPQANYGAEPKPDSAEATPFAPEQGISDEASSLGGSTPASSTLGSSTPRYEPAGQPADQPAAEAEASSGFEPAWKAVTAALEQNELSRAHRMLSAWRREPSLSPEQQQRVESLLGQLAGTVVYSTEHRLEPPHVVASGETLATIAEQYDVPWQLLAKINGIPATDAVTPGQSLKVVRGPFNAEVDLKRGELTLLLDDRYAGKFPVQVEGIVPTDTDWRVGQKRLESSSPEAAKDDLEPKVVLENSEGKQVELSSSPATGNEGRISVASRDLGDLFDILSVGSNVTVRR